MYDVVVVGGGPAGLSAAQILGRARRSVLVCDVGSPRNAASLALHGFLTRDGVSPREILRLGREEVARYGVEVLPLRVLSACAPPVEERHGFRTAFRMVLEGEQVVLSRKLLLATGMLDVLPEIEGLGQFYGRSVHHCPYCDGWEHRDQRLAAFGPGKAAVGLALSLRTWSEHVVACAHGVALDAAERDRAARNGIVVREEPVLRLEGAGEILQRVIFAGGPPCDCDALFFNTEQFQRSDLPAMLGCRFTANRHARVRRRQRGDVPGLFLAGDADGEVQFAIVAAAEGATAAVAINRELQDEDRGEV